MSLWVKRLAISSVCLEYWVRERDSFPYQSVDLTRMRAVGDLPLLSSVLFIPFSVLMLLVGEGHLACKTCAHYRNGFYFLGLGQMWSDFRKSRDVRSGKMIKAEAKHWILRPWGWAKAKQWRPRLKAEVSKLSSNCVIFKQQTLQSVVRSFVLKSEHYLSMSLHLILSLVSSVIMSIIHNRSGQSIVWKVLMNIRPALYFCVKIAYSSLKYRVLCWG